jgi:hypothetical protein
MAGNVVQLGLDQHSNGFLTKNRTVLQSSESSATGTASERGRKRTKADADQPIVTEQRAVPLGLNPQGTGFLCTTLRRSSRQTIKSPSNIEPMVQLGLNAHGSGYLYSKQSGTANGRKSPTPKRSCIRPTPGKAAEERIVQLGLHPLGCGYMVERVTRRNTRQHVRFSEKGPKIGTWEVHQRSPLLEHFLTVRSYSRILD